MPPTRRSGPGQAGRRGLAPLWALAGVLFLLAHAVVELGRRGIAVVAAGLGPLEWVALALLASLFLYGEGVLALQRRWVPSVVRRAARLSGRPPLHHALLAPLYALGLVGAPRAVLLRSWAGAAAIVLAVVGVRALPEPWRGIVDLSVALALLWGAGALAWRGLAAPAPEDHPGG